MSLLREIETEEENPLKIIDCFCRFKVEDEAYESLCNPNHQVQDVRCIHWYIESLNDKPYVVYYKKQRLNVGENLRRFCFENEHITVKSLEAKFFLNGKPISVYLKTIKTMEELRIECFKIMKLTVKQNVLTKIM